MIRYLLKTIKSIWNKNVLLTFNDETGENEEWDDSYESFEEEEEDWYRYKKDAILAAKAKMDADEHLECKVIKYNVHPSSSCVCPLIIDVLGRVFPK